MTTPGNDTGFDVEDEIPELSYRFKRGEDKKIIPEPSTDQVAEFYAGLARLNEQVRANQAKNETEAEEPENESPDERDLRIEERIAREQALGLQFEHERCRIYAAVCSNTPSYDELQAQPHRVRRAFFGYIVRMLNPEA